MPIEISLSTAVAGFVGLVAVLAVALGVPQATRIVASHVPVAANTGVCFVLVAIALPAAYAGRRWAALPASGVLAIAGLTLWQIVTGTDIGVDRWLLGAPNGASEMSPQTALAFVLIATAILVPARFGAAPVTRVVSSVVFLLAFVNVLDVLFGATQPTILGSYTQMALPTAIAFGGLATGLAALYPAGSMLELFRLPGPTGTLTRRLTLAALTIPIVVGWLRLAGERAGWYDSAFGVALMTVATVLLFMIAIRATAGTIERAERERRRAEEALGEALDEITDLYDNAPIGYHSLDAEGRFVHINQTELEMLGYERAELIGSRFADLLTPAGLERFAEEFPRFIEVGFVHDLDFELKRKDGSLVPVRLSATALRDADGAFVASRSTVQDVSERRAMEVERERALEEAVAANQAKNRFLSRMSHELRTPLNSVLGFAQLLETDDLTAEQRESAAYIRRAGRHLLELINEVLDISRIDQGSLTISVETVAVRECVDEVTSFIAPLAAERDITVEVAATDCGSWVMADRQRLRQVLLNLLSNAVKYNVHGGRITVSCERIDDRVRLSVADTGPGIPLLSQPRLFQPFDRLGAEATEVEGSGIGLALSRALVDAMGGAIGVDSQPGLGSTFWVEFPSTPAPAAEEMAELEAPSYTSDIDTRCDVLYIEDNPANLRLVERIVERMPRVRLMTAIQGGIGIDLARQHRPSLILLDLHLPDIGGEEVLRQLRADPATRHIPVAILSADSSERQIRGLTAAGADAYLTKPINVQELVDVVERLMIATAVEGSHVS
ncbi:MAG TPA: ATP-binding protein [Candidatus Limnocylindria bacterium]|nr:ATP-binding protein [Candidatus Limnocylindria bacterium]